MQNAILYCCCACVVVGIVACGPVPDEPRSSTALQTGEALGLNQVEGRGYLHAASRSRFHLGTAVAPLSEFGLDKLVGSEGVFAKVIATGWTMGIPNANAPSQLVGRRNWSAAAHNQAVRSYFENAGIPMDQVSRVDAHGNLQAGGPTGSAEADLSVGGIPSGYTSCLARVIGGVPVSDSFAWAGFNDEQDVVEEGVYWPEIPPAVVANAKALQLVLQSGQGSDFKRKVGDTEGVGEVVIHHSPGVPGTAFLAVAAYDKPEGAQTRHFDANGTEFKLAYEHVAGNPSSKK